VESRIEENRIHWIRMRLVRDLHLDTEKAKAASAGCAECGRVVELNQSS